jgi:hypothetical protein
MEENKLATAIALVSELTKDQQHVVLNFITANNADLTSPQQPSQRLKEKIKAARKPRRAIQAHIVAALRFLGPDQQPITIVKDVRGRQEKPFDLPKDDDEAIKMVTKRMQSSHKRFTQEGCAPGGWRLIGQQKAA